MSEIEKNLNQELTDEQEAVQIPYFVHEREMDRMARVNKRLWIILIVIFLAFVGTNAGWIVYESQFEDISVTQETDRGYNSYIGNDGDIYNYGQDKTDNQNP